MADLSVIDVQRHLRNLADDGHDIISTPGSAIIDGENYRRTIGNSMVIPNPGIGDYYENLDSGLNTALPIGESGNFLDVTSYHDKSSRHHYVMSPTIDTRFEPHGHTYNMNEHDASERTANFHATRGTHPLIVSVKAHYDEAHKYPASVRIIHPEPVRSIPIPHLGKALSINTTHEGAMSLSKHNPAEGFWNMTMRHLMGPKRANRVNVPKPAELGFMDMNKFVIVGKAGTDQIHLYSPETEQMVRIH